MDTSRQITPEVRQTLEAMQAELEAKQAVQDEEELQRIESLSAGLPGDNLQRAIGGGMAKAIFETKDFLFGETAEQDKTSLRRSIEAQARALSRRSVGYGMVSGVSQFVTGFIGAGKLLAPIKPVQSLRNSGKAGAITFEVGRGAAAAAIVIDPHEERLSDLIQSFPALENPITEFLAADLTDTAAEGRLKNALEGIGLDLALVGIFAASLRALKMVKGGDGDAARATIAEIEQARQANHEAFAMPGTEYRADPESAARVVPEETAVEARTAAPVSEAPAAATKAEPAPVVAPESMTGLPARQEPLAPQPARAETESETLAAILRASEADARALSTYGSREAATEAGHRFADGARLPWQKLNGTAEVRAFVDNAADALKQQLDARKGGDILSDNQVREMVLQRASLFNEEPDLIMGQIARAGEGAARMVADMEAAFLIANRMLQDTYDVAFKVRNRMLADWSGDLDAATRDLKARLSASADLLASARSMASNSGRALRRMRGDFRIKPEDMARLREMDGEQIAELIYQTKGSPEMLAKAVNPSFLSRALDEATFSLTNSLLWLYPTHVVNITSNLYMLAARPAEKAIGSLAQGRAGSPMRQKALREYLYTVTALGDAWSTAVEAFKRGDSILAPHATEYFGAGAFGAGATRSHPLQWRPVASVWDILHNAITSANYRTIVGLPTRALGMMDEFNKQLRYRAVVQATAATEGQARGLTGTDLKAYIERRLRRSFDEEGRATDSAALREAQTATFQQELAPGTAGATIRNVRATHPSLTFLLPFVKTPINVLRYGWKMTPGLNLLQREFREAMSGKAGAEAQAHAIGQLSLGTLFIGLGAVMALEGRLTGGGPSDPALRQELQAHGWRPYSVVVHGEDGQKRYFPMGRFDPAGMAFGVIADIVNLQALHEYADIGPVLGGLLLSLAHNFSDRTFLQNINQGLRAVSEPETHLERWAGTTAGNTMPLSSLIRGINPDPYMREARSFLDSTLKNLPGYSDSLPPVRDAFGEPVWRRIGLTTTADEDEVEAEHNRIILETGKGIGRPTPKFEDFDLRDITLSTGRNAYDRLQELAARPAEGPSLKDALAALIRSETYQSLPDGDGDVKGTRLNAMARVVAKYREAARKVLLREASELRELIGSRQRAAAGAYLANRRSREPGAVELLESLRGDRGF